MNETPSVGRFEGKVALITGGTVGVGLDIARRLLSGGAHVVLNGRSADRGGAAVAKLQEVSQSVSFVAGDCGDYYAARGAIDEVVESQGGIDLLVSSGAESTVGPTPFAELTGEQLSQALTARYLPRVYPLHAAMRTLRERRGTAVLLTTDAARVPTPGESIVGAAGAAVIATTRAVAKESARDGVRVNAVALTLTSGTAAWDRVFAEDNFQKKLFSTALTRFPQGRPPTAEEVAEVVVFLLSDAAAQVTGQTISVNGGLSFGGW